MRGRSTWLISAAGTYKPRFVVYIYEIYKPRPDQSDYSIPRSCALIFHIDFYYRASPRFYRVRLRQIVKQIVNRGSGRLVGKS